MRQGALPERGTRARRLPHRLLDDGRARQGPQTPLEPSATQTSRRDNETHARRQVRRIEEPRQPDRQAVRGVRKPEEHGFQGAALPRMTTQGTIEDPAQTPLRTSQGRVEPLGVLGIP